MPPLRMLTYISPHGVTMGKFLNVAREYPYADWQLVPYRLLSEFEDAHATGRRLTAEERAQLVPGTWRDHVRVTNITDDLTDKLIQG